MCVAQSEVECIKFSTHTWVFRINNTSEPLVIDTNGKRNYVPTGTLATAILPHRVLPLAALCMSAVWAHVLRVCQPMGARVFA